MSVITLQIAHATKQDTVVSKRKFLAPQNIFSVSDIEFVRAKEFSIMDTFPDFKKACELYQEYESNYRKPDSDSKEIYKLQRQLEESHPFVTYGNKQTSEFYVKFMMSKFKGLKKGEITLQVTRTEMPILLWPSITIKSLDQTEETLYFFSMEEAETALNLILEGINNG